MSWQFRDGTYFDYDPQSNSLIEAAFQAKQPSITLHLFNQYYVIDLVKKTQTNKYSGATRPIRRLTAAKQATKEEYLWWFSSDDGWSRYSPMQSAHIEKMYQVNPKATISLKAAPYTYIIDFQAMTQRNTTTNKVRSVERRVVEAQDISSPAGASNGGSTASKCVGDYISEFLARLPPYPLPAPYRVDFESVPLSAFIDADHVPTQAWSEECQGECAVCMGPFADDGETLTPLPCGHVFHTSCISVWLKNKGTCPNCRRLIVVRPGGCPDGTMTVAVILQALPGDDGEWDGGMPDEIGSVASDSGNGDNNNGISDSSSGGSGGKTIVITWGLHGGIQDHRHPNAGVPYPPDTRIHYMPANRRGVRLLQLFIKGWVQRQLFTVGKSLSRNVDNVVIYGSVHMRSNKDGPFGWPAPTYYGVTEEEFRQVGIKYDDE